ncbi:dipeptidyl-peptidase 4 [Fusarium beomiforme]|uniref:Dipeptidyl-peptidase 4 n=1 Tax=Fusarium beomiforme TaxID=44412 RepID=A0A9P5A7M3_9HYPO|nr:dipeptidyl-peptidase 4 [Fusarium beomiforme]
MVVKLLTTLLALAPLGLAIDPPRQPHQPVGEGDRLLTFNETSPSAKLRPTTMSVEWSSAGQDGNYIVLSDNGDLVLEDIISEKTTNDAKRVLVASNYTKQYRYSYFADYFILDVESGESEPLMKDQVGDIQYAQFAPSREAVAFMRGNNLFIRDADGEVEQITSDRGPDMFHGVPNWVYEEIYGGRSALWWSPDAKFLAFLSFNETSVGTFTIPYYIDNQKLAPTYPRELDLRYPKVGSKNPTVELNILDGGKAIQLTSGK